MRHLIIMSLLGLLACNPPSKTESELPNIVATTGMIGDALKILLQESANVESLMGPGVDPHLFKASQGDLSKLTNADMIFYNGLHLEGKMVDIFENMAKRKSVVAVTDDIDRSKLRMVAAFNNNYDPHIWFDITMWIDAVNKMALELGNKYPELKSFVNENAKQYITELEDLNNWVNNQISTINKSQRVLITAHDAFGYFGLAYDIEVLGLQGISTLSEPGLRDVSDLVEIITTREIKAVFVETSVSQRSINAVIEGCRSNGFDVKNGGYLFSDAMGESGTPEGNYIGMVKANVNTIVNALK